MNVYSKITKALASFPNATDPEIVRLIVPELTKEDIDTLVLRAVQHSRSVRIQGPAIASVAREMHRIALQAERERPGIKATTAQMGEAFRAIFGVEVIFGLRCKKRAELATLDDWKARRDMLNQTAAGLREDLDVCRKVITHLEAAGVDRLIDLKSEAAA